MGELDWQVWNDEAFAEARRLERPVFFFLEASWCRFCQRMHDEVFTDPNVIELLSNNYVCIRADKEQRPDLNDRYNLGGWPSCSILTYDGEIITGGTYFTSKDLQDLLERSARFFVEHRNEIASLIADKIKAEEERERKLHRRPGELCREIVDRVSENILSEFDSKYGGFGSGQKFPHCESLDFALLRYVKTSDERMKEVVEKTLSMMQDSAVHDTQEGGFFRYSTSPDWRNPHTEKLLETNVGLLRNFLEAHQVFGRSDFRKVAEGIVNYLRVHLRHPEYPAFCGSQDCDDDYYALDASARRERPAPVVDPTIYVNWNAAAVSALFKASSVLDDSSCYKMAQEAIDFLLEECYDSGRGMYHYHDGSGRHLLGLLTDQAYTVRALIHATQFTGDRKYLDVAQDLLSILIDKHDSKEGGFYDLPADARGAGGLRRRNVSILENGLLAEVLLRMAHLTLNEQYMRIAEKTLSVFAADYVLYGYFTAGYARAVDLFFNQPVHAVIVGDSKAKATRAMVKAAMGLYLPSKMVQVIDPAEDEDLLKRFKLPSEAEPTAYVTVMRTHVGKVTDPALLAAAMLDADKGR